MSSIFETLENVALRAHAPYSNLRVAACVVSTSGQRFFGCNVENVSFPLGTCAEAGAISAMIAAGATQIAEVHLYSIPYCDIVPCGGCLQRVREFANSDTTIYSYRDATHVRRFALSQLLPQAFAFPISSHQDAEDNC